MRTFVLSDVVYCSSSIGVLGLLTWGEEGVGCIWGEGCGVVLDDGYIRLELWLCC